MKIGKRQSDIVKTIQHTGFYAEIDISTITQNLKLMGRGSIFRSVIV